MENKAWVFSLIAEILDMISVWKGMLMFRYLPRQLTHILISNFYWEIAILSWVYHLRSFNGRIVLYGLFSTSSFLKRLFSVARHLRKRNNFKVHFEDALLLLLNVWDPDTQMGSKTWVDGYQQWFSFSSTFYQYSMRSLLLQPHTNGCLPLNLTVFVVYFELFPFTTVSFFFIHILLY